MKRALILGLLCLVTAISAETPNLNFAQNLERFHHHYDLFIRAYAGCPKGAAFIEQCKPELGTFDYYEFNHAAREAGPLFGLK
jgi:hypothetical protein